MNIDAPTPMLQQNSLPPSKWKPYPVYKNSGVEWLGEIPAHWEVKRLKNVTQINPEVLPETANPDYALQYIDITNVSEKGSIIDVQEMRFEDAPSRARRIVKHGDSIISTVRTYLKAIGFINDPPENLIVSTGFAVLRAMPGVKPGFLWRLVQSQQFVDSVVSHSEGVSYPAINPSRLACLSILLPPVEEQTAITGFIDQETAKIDALVAKKERQIELLQEKRSALISRTVTRGLDPNVPLKDSGIEWLGHIPAHWEVKRLKFSCQINPSKAEIANLPRDLEVSFLPMDQIGEEGNLILHDTHTIDESWQGYTYFRDNDVILAKITPCFENGKGALCIGLLNGLGFGTTELHVLRPYPHILAKFVFYLTKSHPFRKLGTAGMYGAAGQKRVPENFINNFKVGLPYFAEQQVIVNFLDQETTKIDALITKIREGIDRLKEYRNALISAAVTGKIDVRQEVLR
jgi:type I restriction enzyme S subunit